MPQFGASLADDSRVVIYDCNMFIVQSTGLGQCSVYFSLMSMVTSLRENQTFFYDKGLSLNLS